MAVLVVSQCLTLLSVYLWSSFGEVDFDTLGEPSGKYKVGHRTIWTKKKGNHVQVFYPIERSGSVPEVKRASYLQFGEADLKAAALVNEWFSAGPAAAQKDIDQLALNHSLDHVKPDFIEEGAAVELTNCKLVPIIFSHGLAGQSQAHTGHLRELASHGFIVFAINSLDGSCAYTEKEDGTGVFFDARYHFGDFAVRKRQLQTRVDEIIALIDELHEKEFLEANLAIDNSRSISLDLGRLVVSGHSFGGATALAAAAKDRRVKAVSAMDPWFFPLKDLPADFTISNEVPVQCIRTQHLYEWLAMMHPDEDVVKVTK